MWAAGKGETEIVKFLLDYDGIATNASICVNNFSPIIWATINKHEEIVKMLANPKYMLGSRDWDYIIERTEKLGFPEAVKLLKKYRY